MKNDVILKVSNLQKYFPIKMGAIPKVVGYIKAVDGVSFEIKRGEVLGIVGESGCGKSTLARTILRLIEPTGGSIIYEDVDITKLKKKELRKYRKRMQMVFQDPYTQLNPRMNVKGNIGIAIKQHFKMSGKEVEERVGDLLESVGLNRRWMYRYPHEFSGGQLQRIAIARALSVEPEFLVLDEPTSALDVSVQAQILNLLIDIRKKHDLTYLFISHNLSVIEYISDKVGVMYLGKIVEFTDANELFKHPIHPYTKMLLSSIPPIKPKTIVELPDILGEVPSARNIPPGCRFHPRCPYYREGLCDTKEPELVEVRPNHYVACHISDELK
ncbi:MAG: ABC transporter ATP-binding protein [Candidatus Njordarchaeia archaeon]